ncbi:MAG: hypothetical protein GX943_01635 [Candidatus Pacebacteria bacterium]|nr:hypothetical protein [Candidatus Paceibacterota bacterium]
MRLVLFLALLLRLIRLSDSFWLDEAAQVLESARPLTEQLQIAGDFQPPLMHLLTFFWLRFLGLFNLDRIEALVRLLPSVIPGIISIWASYQIVLKIWPKQKTSKKTKQKRQTIAFFSALFLATSPLHIFFSQELRPYSLAMMWGTLSLLAMLNWANAQVKSNKTQTKSHGAGHTSFIIFNILGLYTSYLYPFFLIMQLAYLFVVKKFSFKKILTPLVLIVLAFLPWLPKLWEQLTVGQALRAQMPGWAEVVSLPQLKSLPLVPLKFIYGLLNIDFNVFFVVSSLLIFGLIAYLIYQQRSQKETQQALTFFTFFFLAPLLFIWLFSFFIPVLQPKRVLFLLPAFFILISHLIVYAKKNWQILAQILLLSIFAIHLFALTNYWLKPQLQRENWRTLVGEIEQSFGLGKSVAVFSFSAPFAPFEYYQEDYLATFATGSFYLPNESDLPNKIKVLADYDYVLLFDYLRDLTDPQDQLPSLIKDLGFAEIGVYDYPNIGFVRIYTKESLRAYENRLRCQ